MPSKYSKIVRKAQELYPSIDAPVFPVELHQLQTFLEQHETADFQKVANLISKNPYLAAELVSLANAPIFNPKLITIKDLEGAIFRLGTTNIRDYVFSIHIKKHFLDRGFHGLSMHSQTIALITATIANFVECVKKSEAYFLGLVHDIGTFAIHQLDDSYGMIFNAKNRVFTASNEQEFHHYGTSHSAFGYVLAKELNLPEEIAQTILLHHERDIDRINNPKIQKNVAILELAHLINHQRQVKSNALNQEQTAIYEMCCKVLQTSPLLMNKIQRDVDAIFA